MSRFGGRSLWDPGHNPLVYFILALLVGASVNVLSGWLATNFPFFSAWGSVAIVVGAFLLLLSPLIRQSLLPQRVLEPISSLRVPAKKRRGLIAFVSIGGGWATADAAIRYHKELLIWVWLLHSPASKLNAEKLAESFGDLVRLVPMTEEEFGDPEAVKEAIQKIYSGLRHSGLEESDVVIDITGGTKTTTAGAFLAGLPAERNLQVIRAATKDSDGRAIEAGEPIEIDINYTLKPIQNR
jgi:CRISPR-associated protein (Cas_Cas02710)